MRPSGFECAARLSSTLRLRSEGSSPKSSRVLDVVQGYGLTITGFTVVLMTSLSTAARPSISLI